MKFNELLNQIAAVIPAYHQIVFKTIIIAFCAGGSPGRTNNVFRKFALLLTGNTTINRQVAMGCFVGIHRVPQRRNRMDCMSSG